MGRIRRALERHRPAAAILALLLLAGLFPAGPFGLRARLAGLLTPLALLQGGEAEASDNPGPDTESVRRLREEVDFLRAELAALRRENASLRDLGGLGLGRSGSGHAALAAAVVGRDRAWPFRRSLLLDRGTRDGVLPGQPVVVGRSLAGFVVEAGPMACRVQLLDDPGARADDPDLRVGVAVIRPGGDGPPVEGAVVGLRRGVLGLRMVPAGSVREGDLVVTSAADPRVPPGLLVGRVAPGVRDGRRDGLAEGEVIPTAPTPALRSVAILVRTGGAAAAGGSR